MIKPIEYQFTLLGRDEADYAKGTISIQSPVGVALLGKEVGDEITVKSSQKVTKLVRLKNTSFFEILNKKFIEKMR